MLVRAAMLTELSEPSDTEPQQVTQREGVTYRNLLEPRKPHVYTSIKDCIGNHITDPGIIRGVYIP